MSLHYAGIGLPLSTPELEDRLSRIHPPELFRYADFWNFEGYGLSNLPTPTLPDFPPVRPGVLRWPTGATRFATFFAVVNTDRLNDIRGAVGDPQVAQSLQMSDGRQGKVVTAEMLMLPAVPLAQLGNDLKDSWLLLLVDARFFWQWRYGNVTNRDSWEDLIAELAATLGVTVTPDTINAAYTAPTEKWLGFNRPTATVLDAALAQVGHRLVADMDGTYRTVTWETAKQESDNLIAGATASPVIAGGLLADSDIALAVPGSVDVFFASGGGGCCAPAPYTVNRTLAGLEIEEYGSSTGLTGAVGNVYGDAIFDGTNANELSDYADVAATDFYGWRAANADVVFPGVEPWAPTGFEEFVEWTYQLRDGGPYASTMVRRGEFDALPSGSWEVGDCCEFFVKISGGSDAAGYSGTRVVEAGPNVWVPATAPEPLTFSSNIRRAPSNEVSPLLPAIPANQVVRAWRSPTYGPVSGVPQYECLPWGGQIRVTGILGTDCNSYDLLARDLVKVATSPPPPPPPALPPTIVAYPTMSPGAGVIRTGTNARVVTRGASGGAAEPYGYLVDFGDGVYASGADVQHVYATGGVFYPNVTVFDASGNTSGPLLTLGGDGNAHLTVLDDPGLALTLQTYRLEENFEADDDTAVLIPALTAWVSSGLSYEFELSMPATSGTTAGIKVGIGGTATLPPPPPAPGSLPATPDLYFQTFTYDDTDAAPTFTRDFVMGDTNSYDGAADYFVTIRGSIRVNEAGTIGPLFGQAVTDAAATGALVGTTFVVRLTQPPPG